MHFDNGSSFERLGVAFNQMADNINALIASKTADWQFIAHELARRWYVYAIGEIVKI